MKKDIQFWHVDSFADAPFKGNPAVVYVLYEELDDEILQNIAIEMNQSETAFIMMRNGQPPVLRWFTTAYEIDLCGHATLAAAHVYLTEIRPDDNSVTFDTKFVGPLRVDRGGKKYTMDFPARAGEKLELRDIPSVVLDGLGVDARPIAAYKARDLMLVYAHDDIVRTLKPDFNTLAQYNSFVIVTAPSVDTQYDFISRCFCADDAIAEDPVTGSAHCTLAPYWSTRLQKTALKAYQASRRGGALDLELVRDRVMISGQALTLIHGHMRLPRP